MELENYNDYLPPISNDAFAWRYMNFNKTIDFLNGQIHFTRLDKFEDKLEGLPLNIRLNLYLKNISKFEPSEDALKNAINSKANVVTLDKINKWQKGVYATCWYLTEGAYNHHESLAMWGLCDENSFVIKIAFDLLYSSIEKSLTTFDDEEINEAKFGRIEYLSLLEDSQRFLIKIPMPSLIKDKSYKHENEVRFSLLKKSGNTEREGIKLKLNKVIKNNIELFCHPNMDISNYKIYKEKFNKIGYDLQYSKLLTKEIVKQLIVV